MKRRIQLLGLCALAVICLSFAAAPSISTIKVSGHFHSTKGDVVAIKLFDLQTGELKKIDPEKHKFEFKLNLEEQQILTLVDDDGKGKSIYISTYSDCDIEKSQHFIMSVGMNKKTTQIGDADHAEKCIGMLQFNSASGKFGFQKKTIAVKDIQMLNHKPKGRI